MRARDAVTLPWAPAGRAVATPEEASAATAAAPFKRSRRDCGSCVMAWLLRWRTMNFRWRAQCARAWPNASPSDRGVAAVDQQVAARHEGGGVAREVDGGARDLLGP